MLYNWRGKLDDGDLSIIRRSPIVHVLSRLWDAENIKPRLEKTGSLETIVDKGFIVAQLNEIKKVNGLLFITTFRNIDKIMLMSQCKRLKCPIVLFVHKKV